MKLPVLLLVIVLFSFLPYSVDAEIYKWKDENGKLHFSDTPPENKKAETREYEDSYGSEPGKDQGNKEECDGRLREGEKCAMKDGKEIIIMPNGGYRVVYPRKEKTRTQKYLEAYDRKTVRDEYYKAATGQKSRIEKGKSIGRKGQSRAERYIAEEENRRDREKFDKKVKERDGLCSSLQKKINHLARRVKKSKDAQYRNNYRSELNFSRSEYASKCRDRRF